MMRYSILILFFTSILIWSCEGESSQNEITFESTYSECKGNDGLKSGVLVQERITIVGEGNSTFKITYENGSFNCCLPKGIAVTVEIKSDSLMFDYFEKEQGQCKCTCPYDVNTKLSPINDGQYVVCILKSGVLQASRSVLFKATMNESWVLSEVENFD